MKTNKCGVCNYEIPINHAQLVRQEKNGSFTSYHLTCENEAKEVKPCEDCGYHRLICSDCAEFE